MVIQSDCCNSVSKACLSTDIGTIQCNSNDKKQPCNTLQHLNATPIPIIGRILWHLRGN